MHQPVFHRGRLGAPAPAAALLLALCLLAVGAQAVNETANTSVPVAGDGQNIDRLEFIPTPVITAQPTPTLCGYADAYPMPNFTVDRTSGPAPFTVRFTDTSSEWAYDWHWDFGDGSNSTEESPVHTFRNPGVYPVTLSINEHDHFIYGCMWVHYWSDPQHGTKTAQVTVEGTDPTPYKPLAIPGRIQAEDYNLGGEGVAYHDTTAGNSGGAYRQDSVDIETQDGVTNVGWIRTGEFLTYTVNVTKAGWYLMAVRVASPNSGRTIAVSVDGTAAGMIAVPNTGSFATFGQAVPAICPTVSPPLTPVWPPVQPSCYPIQIPLAVGTHTLKLAFAGDGQNLDWIEFVPVNQTPVPNGTTPYRNVTIPGTIQAEDYDLGGESVAYHDTTVGNSGGAYRTDDVDVAAITDGYAVVGIAEGEYLTYTIGGVSPTAELPALVLYLASDRDGGSVQVEVNGMVAGTVSVPNTGSATTFQPVQTQVVAAEGTLRLRFHGAGIGMDRIESPVFASYADAYATPNFTADPTNGTAPLSVHFTDTSSEWAYEWRWDFGDGATSTVRNPVHTFQHPGVYNVSLTIKESDRWSGGTILNIWNDLSHGKTEQVTVEGPGPIAGHAVPGTIQAEDYDAGGEGVAYHDTTPGNEGGTYRTDGVDIENQGGTTNVGWIRTGEWLTYTATVAAPGQYTMRARVASLNSGRTIAVTVDGAVAGTIAVPNTGSFAAFTEVPVPVTLAAGTHSLRLTFQGDGQNLDSLFFWPGLETTIPTSPPTSPVPSSGASFTAVPVSAPHGSAVKFTVTPAGAKTIASAWWSFDAPAHLNTWNSRATNPTFFYPSAGTFSPLVKLTYTDGTTETVQRTNYVRAT